MKPVVRRAILSLPLGLLLAGVVTAGSLVLVPSRMIAGSWDNVRGQLRKSQVMDGVEYQVARYCGTGITQYMILDWSGVTVMQDYQAAQRHEAEMARAPTIHPPYWAPYFDGGWTVASGFGFPFRCIYFTEEIGGNSVHPSIPLTFRGRHYHIPVGIIWSGLLLNLSIASLSAFALLSGASVVRATRRRRNRLCIHCAYPASPSTPICPECGRA
jgi:hypothetical protein